MKMDPDIFQWCLVPVQEALSANCKTRGSLQTCTVLCGRLSSGTGCPEKLCSLHPWESSKTTWTWAWALWEGKSLT